MLALIAAMDEELAGIRDSMIIDGAEQRSGIAVQLATRGNKKVLLVKSGVGRQRSMRTCKAFLDRYPVTAMVSMGFAGALRADLKVGELVACSSMACAEPSVNLRYESDERLLGLAMDCRTIELQSGTGVTASKLVASGGRKRALFESTKADIVDMESYWIGLIAAQNGIPFIAVRAISDSATDSLPELPSYRPRHTIPYFAMHPLQGISLYRGVARARANMAAFAGHIIEVAA
jgi:adenosylhomocysteine nucleosidase